MYWPVFKRELAGALVCLCATVPSASHWWVGAMAIPSLGLFDCAAGDTVVAGL